MASRYDEWLATTPEDEQDAANERDKRRDAASERALDRYLDGRCEVGTEPQPRDPEAVDRSLSEVARLNRLFGADWVEGLPV